MVREGLTKRNKKILQMANTTYSVLLLAEQNELALAVIRSLGMVPGVEVHLASNKKSHAKYSKYLCSFHLVDNEKESNRVKQVVTCAEKVKADVLLPVDVPAMRFAIRHLQILSKAGMLPPLPESGQFERVIDKYQLNRWLQEHDFPTARFTPVVQKDDYTDAASQLKFPILLKPVKDEPDGASQQKEQQNLYLFETSDEWNRFLQDHDPTERDAILQEYIPGYDIDCSILARDGQILAHTIQKGFILQDLQYSPGIELIHNQSLYKTAREIISVLNWSGICHLDFRRDKRDSTYKLVDFNARFWTTLQGSLGAGVNFPHLTCLAALGVSFEQPDYEESKFVMTRTALKHLFTPTGANRFSLHETGFYYVLKDPVPSLVKAGCALKRALSSNF